MVLSLIPLGLVVWLQSTDPHIGEVKEYLLSNSEICPTLGRIEKLSLRRTSISMRNGEYGRAKEPDRIRYTFIATGAKGRETIRVNVKISATDQVGDIDVKC